MKSPNASILLLTALNHMLVSSFIFDPLQASKRRIHAGHAFPSPRTFTSLYIHTPPLPSSSDPFYILDLNPLVCDRDQIKRAYKRRALQYHPDVRLSSTSTEKERKMANEEFARINSAYAILMEKFGNVRTSNFNPSSTPASSTTFNPTQASSTYSSSSNSSPSNWNYSQVHWHEPPKQKSETETETVNPSVNPSKRWSPSWDFEKKTPNDVFSNFDTRSPSWDYEKKTQNDVFSNFKPRSPSWDFEKKTPKDDFSNYNTNTSASSSSKPPNDFSSNFDTNVSDETKKNSFGTIFSDFLSELVEGDLAKSLNEGSVNEIKNKLDDVTLLAKQLEKKDINLKVEYDNICEKLSSHVTSKSKTSSSSQSVLDRLQLSERKSEIKAATKEVKKYMESAQTYRMMLQSRYESLIELKKVKDLLISTQAALEDERVQHQQTKTVVDQQPSSFQGGNTQSYYNNFDEVSTLQQRLVDHQVASTTQLNVLKSALAAREKEIFELNSKIFKLNDNITRVNQELEKTKQSYSDELSQLKNDKLNLTVESHRYKQEISDAQNQLSDEKLKINSIENLIEKKMESISKQIEHKDAKINQLSSSLSSIKEELSASREKLDHSISDKKKADRESERIIASLRSEINKEKTKKNEMIVRVEETKDELSKFAEEIKLLRQEIQEKKMTIQQLEKNTSETKKENESLAMQLRNEKQERVNLDLKFRHYVRNRRNKGNDLNDNKVFISAD